MTSSAPWLQAPRKLSEREWRIRALVDRYKLAKLRSTVTADEVENLRQAGISELGADHMIRTFRESFFQRPGATELKWIQALPGFLATLPPAARGSGKPSP